MCASRRSSHFNIDSTWHNYGESSIEEERLRNTLAILPPDVASILDVGCGSGRLLANISPVIKRTGVDLSLAALQMVDALACQSDICCLPFDSNGFDAVLATEVLEHISVSAFRGSLAELVRVARKYIILSVPYCETLTDNHVVCPACGCQFHRSNHVRSFFGTDMTDMFTEWPSLKLLRCYGICKQTELGLPGTRAALHRLAAIYAPRAKPYARNRICPQCGFLSGNAGGPDTAKGNASVRALSLKSHVATTLWPKIVTYRWWLALYEKAR